MSSFRCSCLTIVLFSTNSSDNDVDVQSMRITTMRWTRIRKRKMMMKKKKETACLRTDVSILILNVPFNNIRNIKLHQNSTQQSSKRLHCTFRFVRFFLCHRSTESHFYRLQIFVSFCSLFYFLNTEPHRKRKTINNRSECRFAVTSS